MKKNLEQEEEVKVAYNFCCPASSSFPSPPLPPSQ